MGLENFAQGIGKWTWGHLESGLFKFLERKAKESAQRYPALSELHRRWMKVNWGYAAEQYREYVREFHGQFRVFGMQREVALSDLATDVFLLDQPEFSRYGSTHKRISGLRFVFNDARGQKSFVWGEPGAGKTTFLKQVVQASLDKETDKIPIFISIAEWANTTQMDYRGLLDYIAIQFKQCGFDDATIFIDYIIEEGIAILLFDGLDEIQTETQKSALTLLNILGHGKCQILITCRIAAINSMIPGFWEVQVARWDESRIKDFLSKRFSDPRMRDKFMTDLADPEKRVLQDIKSNPLLLSLLCWAFDPKKGFPENRAKIYSEATRHLLTERDQEKAEKIVRDDIYSGLTLSQKETLYAHLAHSTFEKGELYFEQERLEQRITSILSRILGNASNPIDGSVILPKLVSQHGILARRGYRTYAFAHLSFQEYYAAKYIADQAKPVSFSDLMAHLAEPRWREVFLLTAGLMEDARDFFIAAHRVIQKTLAIEPSVTQIQAWVDNKASLVQTASWRSLYWFQILNLCRTHHLDRNRARTHKMMNEIAKALDYAIKAGPFFFSLLEEVLDYTKPTDYARVLDYIFTHVRAPSLERNLDRLWARYDNGDSDDLLALGFDRIRFLDLARDCEHLRKSNPKLREYLGWLLLDLVTTYVVLFTKLMSTVTPMVKSEARRNDFERRNEFATIIQRWQAFCKKLYRAKYAINIPKISAPDSDWDALWGQIYTRAQQVLGNPPDLRLNNEEYQTIHNYLYANLLFFACLKASSVKDRDPIINMILKG